MPPYKKKAPSASSSRNAGTTAKAKSNPYNRNAKDTIAGAKKTHSALASKPTQARNKHKNMNLTSELDSLLGDLNTQLQRKKTKRDVRSVSWERLNWILLHGAFISLQATNFVAEGTNTKPNGCCCRFRLIRLASPSQRRS